MFRRQMDIRLVPAGNGIAADGNTCAMCRHTFSFGSRAWCRTTSSRNGGSMPATRPPHAAPSPRCLRKTSLVQTSCSAAQPVGLPSRSRHARSPLTSTLRSPGLAMEAKTDAATAKRFLGLCNNFVTMRTTDPATQEYAAEQFSKVSVSENQVRTGTFTDTGSSLMSFSSGFQETLSKYLYTQVYVYVTTSASF